jgi:hypothetical protein
MLPNFLIIGAQKAATSWLAKCMGEHPDVLMSDIKEIRFFNNEFERGLNWYESHFADWSGQTALGEATPGYICHPDAPARIRTTLGDRVKLIASLRHPVDRAYSAFWHYVQRGRMPADTDFRSALQANRFEIYLWGCYYTHLSRYLECFSRDSLMVLIYEDIKRDNPKAIRECFQFVGVSAQFIPSALGVRVNRGRDLRLFHGQANAAKQWVAQKTRRLPKGIREPVRRVGRAAFEHLILRRLPKRSNYMPLDPGMRQELLADYMPGIKRLEELLDRDLSVWYEPAYT